MSHSPMPWQMRSPKEVKSGVNKKEAEEIKAKLEAAGAKVELK